MENLSSRATIPLLAQPGKPFSAESIQEMWRMVLDTLRDPVFLHDRNGCITRANWVYANRAGLGFAELIGKPYWQVFPKGAGPLCSCEKAIADPSGPEQDEVVEIDGCSFLSRSIPVSNGRGEHLYSVHIMEDITPFQQSATMLNRSEEQFRLVSEVIAEVFWMADISLERIYYVSPGFSDIWGRPRAELYQNPSLFVDAIHPDDRECVLADLDAQKSGLAFDHTCRVVAPDGTVRWIWNRGFPLLDDDGHYLRYLGVALDITEHKQAEQALLASNTTYQEIFNKAGEAMLVQDPLTAAIYDVNQAFCELYGYTHDEAIKLSVAQLSSVGDNATQEKAQRLVQKAMSARQCFEWTARRKDGGDFLAEVTLAGATILSQPRVLATVRDITRRKQAETRLLEANRHMEEIQSAMDQAGIAIHWLDADSGRFIYINDACCAMLGYTREEILALSVPDIDPNFPRTKDSFGTLTAPLRKQKTGRVESINKTRNGRFIPVEVSFRYSESSDGLNKHFIAFVVDITERKQAEAALQHLNETLEQRIQEETTKRVAQERLLIQQSRLAAMGEMVGNIAHQWRQPLNALGLILQNIAYDYEDKSLTQDALNNYVAGAMRDIQQMSGTIDDFRNFFLPNKAKVRFNICVSLGEAIKLVEPSFVNNGITLTRKKCESVCNAFGYPNEFVQVLLNILNNAKDAIVEKRVAGEVHLHAEKNDDVATISIRDNGGGMPEEIQAKIFDPYFTTKAKGTGIGLYMSKMIMDNMGGDIAIRNVEDGTEVLLTLPLTSNPAD